MKQILYVAVLTTGLLACSRHTDKNAGHPYADTIHVDLQDTNSTQEIDEAAFVDTITILEDSLFINLEAELEKINKVDFENYNKNYKTSCTVEPGGFIHGYDLSVDGSCDEICQTYLVENTSGKKILLPSNYDAGISGLIISPSCNQFIVYSSYDGPDYENYYAYRAEIICFTITGNKGLAAIKPSFQYHSKDWSIDELIWINDASIALKIYEDGRSGDGSGLLFKYLKLNLNNN